MEPANINDLLLRYQRGESIKKLAASLGIDVGVIRRWISERGIRIKHGGEYRKVSIPSTVVARYESGESEYAIANSLGIARAPLRKYLLNAGVEIRSHSKAGLVRAKKMTGTERLRQVSAAHAAVRGKPRCEIASAIGARTREKTIAGNSRIENRFHQLILELGHVPTRQKSVGIYNLDFAFEKQSVAVELFGGSWHATGRHARRHLDRSKYLLDCGWDLICIWIDKGRWPLTIGSAEYVAAFLDQVRGLPSGRRQYRMIRGTGKASPAIKSQLNTDTIVERLGGCRNLTECTNLVSG